MRSLIAFLEPTMVTALIMMVTLFVFFSVEQSLISGNLAASRQALAQNNAIRAVCLPCIDQSQFHAAALFHLYCGPHLWLHSWGSFPVRACSTYVCVCVCVCAVWRAFSSALPSSSQANENLESAKVELQDEEDELVNMYSKWLDEDSEEMEVSKEEMTTLKEQLKTVQDNVKAHSESIGTKADALAEKEKRLTVSRRPTWIKTHDESIFISYHATLWLLLPSWGSISRRTGCAGDGVASGLLQS
jgi:hypothetical protein